LATRPLETVCVCLAFAACASSSPSSVADASTTADAEAADASDSDAVSDALVACDVPADPKALFAFIQSGAYKTWTAESAIHPSATGIHAARVRVYANPTLSAGFATSGEQPRCSALVKEFYGANGTTITGYAASVKVDATSSGGRGWYWYETFDAANGTPSTTGRGASICTGCHAAGTDYVRSAWPLM
jgi:hypothetical protein